MNYLLQLISKQQEFCLQDVILNHGAVDRLVWTMFCVRTARIFTSNAA
jgi:hypothetical protein